MNILRAFFSFRGRFNRGEYAVVFLSAAFLLVAGTIGICLLLFGTGPISETSVSDIDIAVLVAWIVLMKWAALAAAAKRFCDIDWSGAACLIVFIPMFGLLAYLVLFLIEGSAGINRFGPPSDYFWRSKT